MKRFSCWLLHTVEVIYLEVHGWKPMRSVGTVYWMPPENYFFQKKQHEGHDHGHAVNSQKAANGRERYENDLRNAGLRKEEDGN